MNDVEKRGGRPTLFTPELGREICSRLEHCGFEAVAAEAVGVHRETLASWRKRGQAGEERFAEFARDLAMAKALWAERELDRIDDSKWKLERADRMLFAATQKLEHTGTGGTPIAVKHEHSLHHLTDAQLERIALGGSLTDDELEQIANGQRSDRDDQL